MRGENFEKKNTHTKKPTKQTNKKPEETST